MKRKDEQDFEKSLEKRQDGGGGQAGWRRKANRMEEGAKMKRKDEHDLERGRDEKDLETLKDEKEIKGVRDCKGGGGDRANG